MISSATNGSTAFATLTTTSGDEPALAASRCAACDTVNFPATPSCPRCGGSLTEPTALATTGTVWTWTIQRFQPKPPYLGSQPFVPFAVGYVDLGVVRVEARLAGKALTDWQIGDPVRLVVGPLDARSPNYETFWFEPALLPTKDPKEMTRAWT
jgi:uncharacterized protein